MHSQPCRIHIGQLLLASALGPLILLLLLCTPALAVAAPGDPDPSFGTGGYVTFDLGERSENVNGVAVAAGRQNCCARHRQQCSH